MKLKEAFLWQPGWVYQSVILAVGAISVLIVGYFHTITGLAYEFHAFFIGPVLAVSWLLGPRYGYALSILAAVAWFLADRTLTGEHSAPLPLVFNTAIRLTIFIGGAWLVGGMRRVMLNESRIAREDALTQLPYRRDFHEHGRSAFAQAQRQGARFYGGNYRPRPLQGGQ